MSLPDSAIAAVLAAAGVASARTPIPVDAPTIMGDPQTSGYADDPVNTTTGNFVEPETDLTFTGGSASLVFTRTYNSVDSHSGAFGPGWSSILDTHVTIHDDRAIWRQETGRHLVFPRHGQGWVRSIGDNYWLTTDPSGELIISNNHGGRWGFTATGHLAWQAPAGPGSRIDYHTTNHLIIDIHHEWGGSLHLTWNPDHTRVTKITAGDGRHLTYTYDTHHRLTTLTITTAHLTHDPTGRITTTPTGHHTHFTYNEAGLLDTRTDPNGAQWHFEYTPGGRLTACVDPLGHRTAVEYGQHGEQTGFTDQRGFQTHRVYDDLGNLASVELPDGSTWKYCHDELSRLLATTDPTGAVWRTEYDECGRTTATIDPTGVRKQMIADSDHLGVQFNDGVATGAVRTDRLGRIVSSIGDDGKARLTRYDLCGRPVEYVDGDGNATTLHRDLAGRITELIRPTGIVTTYGYDSCGRLSWMKDAEGGLTRFEYDQDSLLIREIWPTGEVAWKRYDVCGRESAKFVPGIGTTQYERDLLGRVVAVRDPMCGRRRFVYDAAGHPVEAISGIGGRTRYEYDNVGRLVRIIDPLGAVTSYERNARGQVVKLTDPLGRVTTAGYDQAGRQVCQRNAAGHTTGWVYDCSGRFIAMSFDGVEHHRVHRDLLARRMTITEAGHVHTVSWDAQGNLTSRTRDNVGLAWTYDADGRRATMTRPDGSLTSWQRDKAGRVREITTIFGRVVYRRDATGRLISAAAGGTEQTWQRDNGFITSHEARDGQHVSRTRIGRNDDGQLTWVSRDGSRTDYSYDESNQLVASFTDTTSCQYKYDLAGRLSHETIGSHQRELSYDKAGQLIAITGDSHHRYSYDSVGRRVHEECPDGTSRTFTWSLSGRLEHVSITKDTSTQQRNLFTDALGELASVDDSDIFWDTAANQKSMAAAGNQAVIVTAGFTGTTQGWATSGWRQIRSTASTDPWGVDSWSRLPGGLTLGTAGEILLGDGLEQTGARVYDTSTRGFLSCDPLDPFIGAGWAANPYAYAGNDPVQLSDPTGLRPLTDAQLRAWQDAHPSGLSQAASAVGGWFDKNWQYVAGGAMVVAGAALMCTGVGGTAGLMLVSAGADTIIQKATTGNVNWAEVAFAGVAAPIGGGEAVAGKAAAELAAKETLELAGKETLETTGREAVEQAVKTTAEKPLESVAEVAGSEVKERQLVFRVWGRDPDPLVAANQSGPWGRSWTRVDPRTVANYRDAAGLPDDANLGRFLSIGELVDTTGVEARAALPLGENAGGLDELLVDNPEAKPTGGNRCQPPLLVT